MRCRHSICRAENQFLCVWAYGVFDVEGYDKVDAKMSAEDAETVKKMFDGKSAYLIHRLVVFPKRHQ